MTAQFEIMVEPRRDLLHIKLTGFFGPEHLKRLENNKRIAMRQLTCPANQHVTLCDLSESQLLAQDMIGGFSAMIGDPRFLSRRLALVIPSRLGRFQARHVVPRDDFACFDTAEAAEEWLFAA